MIVMQRRKIKEEKRSRNVFNWSNNFIHSRMQPIIFFKKKWIWNLNLTRKKGIGELILFHVVIDIETLRDCMYFLL